MPDAIGRLFDVSLGSVPADAVAGPITGRRIGLSRYGAVTVLLVTTGASTDPLTATLREHTAASGGTSQNLPVVTRFYTKNAASLLGSERWAVVNQVAAATVPAGAVSQQSITGFCVDAAQLSDGFRYLSVDVPDLGTNGTRQVAVLYLPHELHVQRDPVLMPAPLA